MEVTSERNSAERPEASGEAGHEPAFSNQIRTVNLALEGGGAHGAFTWGVLDRLLDEPRFQVDGLSATSAGAMNAVVLAHGLTTGGRDGAKQARADFWRGVAKAGSGSFLQPSWYDRLTHNHNLDYSPGYLF